MATASANRFRIFAAALALTVAGCQETERGLGGLFPKADVPVPAELVKVMKVKGMASTAPVPQLAGLAPPLQVVNDENVFVKATIDKQTVLPNEQVLLTYTLFTR